jgi:branched-chain amino acid transport system ATP-binding protein
MTTPATPRAPLLELKNLSLNYGGIQALNDVNLHVYPGEVVSLIGSNGAGKSSTLRAISRLIRPRAGQIIYNGADITRAEASSVVKMGIAQSPEGRQVLARQSVRDNLEMGAYTRSDSEIESDIEKQFERFPRLRERRNQMAGTLSGGEQQMLAIARAVMSRPKLRTDHRARDLQHHRRPARRRNHDSARGTERAAGTATRRPWVRARGGTTHDHRTRE